MNCLPTAHCPPLTPLLIQSDARTLPLADSSVHCVVTSPPYWGLRDYGVAGQIGLEPTLAEYLRVMVGVFAEVHRVLRADGTCWVNMGDGYCSTAPGTRNSPQKKGSNDNPEQWANMRPETPAGLKPKDLLMQPHRLAIALQEWGWYVRSDIVWHKPNPMPESVGDRPTKSHEYIFLLSKSERYFYDAEAVREKSTGNIHSRGTKLNPPTENAGIGHVGWQKSMTRDAEIMANGRNLRTVWTMPTRPCKEAHFATFPIDLPLRCIKAGTSEKGVCPACGNPWKRVVEKVRSFESGSGRAGNLPAGKGHPSSQVREGHDLRMGPTTTTTTHWLPTCKCPEDCAVPAIVMDPFGGAATTALACLATGRQAVIVERKWEYLQIGRGRIAGWQPAKTKKPRRPIANRKLQIANLFEGVLA